jgi:LSD1 subclass zinc finger protein
LQCESCGALNAVKSTVIEDAQRKGIEVPCQKCDATIDPGHAHEQAKEVKVATVKCPWCSAWLQYPKGSKEILCSSCGKKLQLAGDGGNGPKSGNAKKEADLRGLIAELKARILQLEGDVEYDEEIMGVNRDEISKLKREIEVHNSTATTSVKRKGGRTRRGFDAVQM